MGAEVFYVYLCTQASVLPYDNYSSAFFLTFVQVNEVAPFVASLASVTKSGLHNPLKAPERYLLYGDVSHKAAALMREKSVEDYFTKLIQRVAPKSDAQARGEFVVTRKFLENFGGDQVSVLTLIPPRHIHASNRL